MNPSDVNRGNRPTYLEINRQYHDLQTIKRELGMDHVEYKLLAKTYERMHDAWLKDGMYDYWDDSDDDSL